MIGYVTMGMSLVPMIGPVIGGVLDDAFGWKANFALLLVLGVAVLALVWADLGETATLRRVSLTDQIRSYPTLLASRRFWGYTLAAAFASGCFFAYLGGAPYVGDKVFGLTSTHVGMLFALTAIGYAGGNFLAGRYSVRLGMNRMVLIGTLVTIVRAGASGPSHLRWACPAPWSSSASPSSWASATASACPTPMPGCCRCAPTLPAPPRALAGRS